MKEVKFATGSPIPRPSTQYAAGYDLRAQFSTVEFGHEIVIQPTETRLIPTGIRMAMPPGIVALVCPRSGMALKYGITVLNAPGVIDPDYRGEVGVILHNAGRQSYHIHPGDKVAQLLFLAVPELSFVIDDLDDTERAAGGFGSTGR